MAVYGTIVVATDFSEHADSAVGHAGKLAKALNVKLVVVYAVHDRLPHLILESSGQTSEKMLERHRAHAEKSLRDYVAHHLPGSDAEAVVVTGLPHDAITRYARERKADLIVVGTHGHGFVAHVLVGSTAERIVHHAPCPVLIVPR